MTPATPNYSLAEKLAIVQVIDSVILVDGAVHKGEIDVLSQLMSRIDFDSNFILQARNLPPEQGLLILKGMPEKKKQSLALILDEVANSDGHFHKKEMKLILDICSASGIHKESL
jgi:uncharacterized tellurite resistance protein B-like protein